MSRKAPWITYRPELKVLDCTIRDGGLVNDSHFSDDVVKGVYEACVDAGIDYMEIGYKNSPERFPADKFGPWRHCHEEDMRRVVGDHSAEDTGLKLCAMADAGGKSEWEKQIGPAKDSVLDVIRVACYANEISEALEMLEHCKEMGYETFLNVMAISVTADAEIDTVLRAAADSPASTVVVVDSFGFLEVELLRSLIIIRGIVYHDVDQVAASRRTADGRVGARRDGARRLQIRQILVHDVGNRCGERSKEHGADQRTTEERGERHTTDESRHQRKEDCRTGGTCTHAPIEPHGAVLQGR